MRKPLFSTFKLSSLTVALIIGLIGVLNFSIAASAPTKSVSEWLFGQSATKLSSGVAKTCADETRSDDVTVADCIARRGKQLLRNSTLSLGENLVETNGSALFGEDFKLKSQLSWGDGSGVQGELDVVIPVWSAAQTKSLFIQPGIAIWPGLGKQKRKRTDANLGLVYRSLNVGGDALFGGSIFYDRNLDHDNQRLALGFDVQTKLGYASVNYYHPLSNDWRQGRSGFEERALRGYDFSLEKLFYQGRIDVDLNLGAWRRNQPSKWVYTYGIDLGYKVTNYLSLSLGYEDFSGQPLSGLPSNQRWQLGLKLDIMKLYAPKPAQNAGNQSPLDLWRTVTREKRILYQERVAGTIIGFAASSYNMAEDAGTMELIIKASKPLSKDMVLTYSTRDGTATAGSDYEAKNGSVTITAGDTSATIQIQIIADTVAEAAERFSVDLSLSTATAGVRVNPATATITINPRALRVSSIARDTAASSTGTTNSNTVSWLIIFSKPVKNVDASDFILNVGGSSIGATASSVPLQSNGTAGQNVGVSNFALNAGGSLNAAEILNVTLRNDDTEALVTARSDNEGTLSLSLSPSNDIADRDGKRLLDTTPTSGVNHDTFTIDSTARPVIRLNGNTIISFAVGGTYIEAGARVTDNGGGDITITIGGDTVDPNTVGTYIVTYQAADSADNVVYELVRVVTITDTPSTPDTTKPVITLTGATVSLEFGGSYIELGARAGDNIDGDITTDIVINSTNINANSVGTYSVTYNVVDGAGNAADEVIRTVKVTADMIEPMIALSGPPTINFAAGGTYIETGARVMDNGGGDIAITIGGHTVDPNTVGTYTVTYQAADSAGNVMYELARVVNITDVPTTPDTTKPVITLLGEASISFEVGGSYIELGAMAGDNIDGDISADIVIDSTNVNSNTVGIYSVTYNVVDDAGNVADEVIRTVNVTADVTKPVITLLGGASVNLEVGYLYSEDGATATDNIDGGITTDIVINNTNVNSNTVGIYSITYNVVDRAGNAADEVIRTVNVTADVTKPVITLLGEASVNLEVGYLYSEDGATATDNIDGEITTDIVINSTHVDANTVGIYSVTYNVVDDAGNAADEVIRTVNVTADVTKPVITLLGGASVNREVGYLYSREGAIATDNIDGDITTDIVINSTNVDSNTVGIYSITYNVVDNAGNTADEVIRTVNVTADVTKPVITLLGEASVNFEVGYLYSEDGATASDNIDGEITTDIVINTTHVDANTVGIYSVTYNVVDRAGNAADEVIRTVNVTADVTKPVITLLGSAAVSLELGSTYSDAGATATDNIDGDITSAITTSNPVDRNTLGTYTVAYNVSDNAGNAADEVTRVVTITADVTKPVITLNGLATVSHEVGSSYTDANATASDNIDGDISVNIVISGSVDVNTVGTYTLSYDVVDDAGNVANTLTRTVTVVDTTLPVITLNGLSTVSLEVGSSYTEAGATASDNVDGDISANIVIEGDTVDANTVSIYSLSYNVVDNAGNAAAEVTRTVIVVDTTLPVITLNGPATVSLEVGDTYTELNATASDNVDGDISANIVISGSVDANTVGTYTLRYNASDSNSNAALTVTRTVIVVDTTLPVITLNGSATVSLEVGSSYTELNATASDNVDGDISANIVISGSVDVNTVGTYTLSYNASDSNSNAALTVTRTVTVVDTTLPVITLNGLSTVSLEVGSSYTDADATASDNVDGDISANIVISGSVDVNTVGTYTLSYNASDSNSNAALTVTRTVTVVDTTLPVITLNGPATVSLEVGSSYTDAGATASDNVDGDISANIVSSGSVDVNTVGTYTLSYNASDSNSNAALTVTRTVTVVDTTLPVITLNGPATVSLEVGSSYTEADATASDNVDGDMSANIVISGSVDVNTVGTYTLSYNASDSNSNAALMLTRTVTVVDTTLPVITLNGPATVSLEVGSSYSEADATASDNADGDISANIVISGSVDVNTVGTYTLSYNASDSNSNAALTVTRTVTVVDTTLPVITLNGPATVSLEVGSSYTDADATASDNVDGDISANIVISGSVDVNTVGTYTLSYNASDSNSNAALTVTRTVTVVDTTLPVITLNGPATVSLEVGSSYSEAGATASDNVDGDISANIVSSGSVDVNTVGTYTLSYNASDSNSNAALTVTRTVTVVDTTLPVITLNGLSTVSLEVGSSYTDADATASDNVDGDISANIVISGSVDVNTVGTYTLSYNASDSNSNAALTVTRTVTVVDTTLPVITLNGPATVSLEVGSSYTDADATASDNVDGDISANIEIGGSVDANTVGTYTLRYNASDSNSNAALTVTRTVIVVDTTLPVITLNGPATVSLEVGSSYTELNATASDNVDGDISANIVISGSVDTNTVGIYTLSYNLVDSNSNAALTVTRTVTVVDTTLPVITLNGSANVSLEVGDTYTELNATASDNVDGDISANIQISGSVDVNTVGTYTLSYNASDSNSNAALTVTRTVTVVDTTLPVITLNGSANVSLEVGDTYTELNATASDNVDGDISANIQISGSVDTSTVGIYTLSYNLVDSNSNAALTVTRTVTVVDTTLPVITLNGPATVSLEVGDSYTELNATASDNVDGDITADIVISGSVDTNTAGTYTLSYNASDSNSNAALTVTRTVTVVDTTLPVITLNGPATVSLEVGDTYTELNATASDNVDGDISANIQISGSVDTSTVGIYTLSYNLVDSNSNAALTVTRTVTVVDTTLPVITLNGSADVSLEVGDTYTELNATASDNVDGDISANIQISGSVDANTVGTYTLSYNASDSNSNAALTVTRTVTVVDTTLPVITLNGPATVSLEVGSSYTELNATASDNVDGDISANIQVSGSVDTSTVGTYTLSYNASDSNSNAALTVTRTVTVVDTTLPVITLNGPATVSLEVGDTYTELNATASDNVDGDISANIQISGSVDTSTVGIYTLSYNLVDSNSNAALTVTRTVTVVDTTLPVITLNGPATVSLEVGSSYTELNATASDNVDGDISANIVISGSVDVNTVGTYTLSYNASDSNSNAALTVTRTVTVVDTTLPVITLNGSANVSLEVGDTYTELNATASDNVDGDISANIQISGSVDTSTVGIYTLSYDVVDDAGNVADAVTRTVTVVDTTLPVITLNGSANVSLEVGDTYTELNATASDNVDGDISANIQISGSVDANTVGTYTLSYNASDSNNNAALTVTRTVTVVDTTLPVITLNGSADISLEVGDTYTELNATASDNVDGDISANIQISGSVDTSTVGIYTLSYNVVDDAGNVADAVTRTVTVVDTTLPVITLNGSADVSLEVGDTYTELNATASDNVDGDISANIQISGSVDANTVGIYTLSYDVVDDAGNVADAVTRTVTVVDTTLPVITLNGSATVSLEVGDTYTELNATASDNVDGDITADIVISGSVDTSTVGIYTLSYNLVDSNSNAALTVTRTVTVVDTTLPVITLNGPATVSLEVGSSYTELNATASDNVGEDISANIVISGSVDASTVGIYTLSYNVVDNNSNAALTVTRTVTVVDTTLPVITLNGSADVNLEVGDTYTELNATASDNVDGDISANIQISGSVDTSTVGIYTLSYNVVDDAGNVADAVTRTVTVVDTTLPVITLNGSADVSLEVGDTYTELNATASDNVDGDISANIQISGSVDANTVGIYILSYNLVDSNSNAALTVTRTVTVVDTTLPVITLNGPATVSLEVGDSYTELNATASDNVDGDITADIVISGSVDTNTAGTYTLSYNASDSNSNAALTVTRTVTVVDTTLPVITLNGPATVSLEVGDTYTELNATASDNVDGDISANIQISGSVDTSTVGIYTLSYNLVDSNSNAALTVTRTVTVVDTTLPVITLNGSADVSLEVGDTYTELNATASDNVDGDISANIQISGSVDANTVGTYTLSYNASDSNSNAALTVTRTVTVVDTTLPVITLNGPATVSLEVGSSYTELNATASDNVDGDISANIQVSGSVDTSTVGIYTLSYNLVDSNSNAALTVTRTVTVVDTTLPVITLNGSADVSLEVGDTYTELNATASDNVDGDISANIQISGSVDVSTVGIYTLSYNVVDNNGNAALTVTRTVTVVDITLPVITLNGPATVSLEVGSSYTELNATASDNVGEDITANIVISGSVDASTVGIYTLSYNVVDNNGNAALTVTRTVTVVDTTLPVITLNGLTTVSLEVGSSYTELNATASDNVDGDISANIVISGSVDVNTVGTYTLSYNASDSNSNAALTVTRTVTVVDTTLPVITLNGSANVSLEVGDTYTELNATASDNVDGDISANIQVSGSVDTSTVGTYTLSYNASDSNSNAALTVIRTVTVVDTTLPVITLNGSADVSLEVGDTYTELNATASDNVDGDISANIVISGSVDVNTVGTYTLSYNASDSNSNAALTVTRTVTVVDTTLPVITLNGSANVSLEVGDTYTELNATASDNVDGDISANIQVSGSVDTSTVGTYTLSYNASDSNSNAALTVTRTVTVVDTTLPVITLNGSADVSLEVGDTYTELNATASDNVDGDISANIQISGSVDTSTVGTYTLSYNASDSNSNAALTVTRTVTVVDTTLPVITLNGSATVSLEVGDTYTELNATASDNVDGDISANIQISGSVDTSTVGTYTLSYNASDSNSNAALTVTRTVTVVDTTLPVITLNGSADVSLEVGDTYTELNATASDNVDGDISANIQISGSVDTSTVGTYTLSYNASDSNSNAALTVTRTVTVVDTTLPVITLNGSADVSLEVGDTYTELNATASDNVDGDISANIVISGSVDASTVGIYTLSYNVVDNNSNAALTVTRTVTVVDTTLPVITLNGPATVSLEVGSSYTELNATASDNVDGDISANIVISGSVDVNTAGTYTLSYNASDSNSNAALTVTRTVTVVDTTLPVITLNGSANVSLEVGDTYTELNATASNNVGEDITANIVISGSVDASTVGIYTLSYNVVDSNSDAALTVTRTVTVVDTTLPVITLNGSADVNLEMGDTYTELNATASDNVDGDISANIVISGSVDVNTAGTYTLSYNASDSNSNAALTVTRTVTVVDTTLPVITLNGSANVSLEVGDTYTELNATASDNVGEDITANIVISGSVDASTVGIYTLSYNVVDSNSNAALTVTRTVTVVDTTLPVITLNGPATVSLEVGSSYTELNATASDNVDGDISANIVISGSVDVNTAGTYTLSYNASDSNSNAALTVTRTVTVVDTTLPVITLNGSANVSLEVGDTYTELNATASDNVGEDITANIVISGSVDASTVGTYTLSYNVIDSNSNAALTVTRTVTVVDTTLPVITLNGSATVSLEVGSSYTELNATASDNVDGDISANIVISGSVDTSTVGIYTLSYNASDSNSNAALTVTRTVTVVDTTLPVITLNGPANVSLEVGDTYTELNATASDNVDGDISANIVISGSVDVNTAGTYTLSYNASDSNSNAALTVTRTVTVVDTTLPVITLNGSANVSLEVGDTYTELNATASDNVGEDITANIVISGSVDASTVGIYTLSYNVVDSNSNAALTVTRTVTVVDTTLPVITLNGSADVSLEMGDTYTELNATASDNVDGDISANIQISGNVDTSTVGIYTLSYNVVDDAGNAADELTRTVSVTDNTAPTVTISDVANNVDATPFTATITFSEAVIGFIQTDITVNNATLSDFSGSGTTYVVLVTPLADGTLSLSVPAGVAVDAIGNSNSASTVTITQVDTIAPNVVSIERDTPTGATTNADSVSWRITFSEGVANLDASDFILIGSTATLSVTPENSDTELVVSASGGDMVDLNGEIGLDFAPAYTIEDRAGNPLTDSTPSSGTNDSTFRLDNTAPEVVTIERVSPTVATNYDVAGWNIYFSERIKNVDSSDFIIIGDSTAIPRFVLASGFGIYVTVSGGDITDFNGDVTLGFADTHDIQDDAGNPLTNTTPTDSNDNTFTFDNIAPEVVSIERTSPTDEVTNIDSVSWRVTFSEAVSNADANDFSLNGTTATLAATVESSAVLVLTASGGDIADLNGQISLDFTDPYTIEDMAGNPLTDTTPSSGTNDSTFTLDNNGPQILSIERASPLVETTNANTLYWRILFSEEIRNADVSDFIFISGSTATHNIVGAESRSELLILFSGGDLADFNGDVTLGFADTHDIQDRAGNPLTDSTPSSGTNDSTFRLDNTAPEVVSIERVDPTVVTNNDFADWNIYFSEGVKNLDSSDFIIIGGSTAIPTLVLEDGFGIVVTVSGDGITDFNGDVTLGFADTHDIQDDAGNPLANTTLTDSNDNTFTFDNIAPEVVSIERASPTDEATNIDSVSWRVTFSETVNNADVNDFSLNGTTATLAATVESSAVLVLTASGGDIADLNGQISLDFTDPYTIEDMAGHPLTDTTPSSGTNDSTFTLDNTAPEVVSIRRGVTQTPALTSADTPGWGILFSERIKNLDASDFILSGGSRAILTIVNSSELSTGQFGIHVTASGGDLSDFNGNIRLGFADGHDIQDVAGNPLTTTTPSGANENTYTLDNVIPTVTVTDLPEDINLTPFEVVIRFSRVVYGLESSGITVSNNATLGAVSGSGTLYMVIVTPTGPGRISVQVAAGAAEDVAGNQNSASREAIGTVVDITPPVITLIGINLFVVTNLSDYLEPGAIGIDNADGDISNRIELDRSDVVQNPQSNYFTYTITYNVSDSSGNAAATVTRKIHGAINDLLGGVLDNTPPVIILIGPALSLVEDISNHNELGAIAIDNVDGNLTNQIVVERSDVTGVTMTIGETVFNFVYTITYNVSDSSGNAAATVIRTIHAVTNDL